MAWGKDRIQLDDSFEDWDLDFDIPRPITSKCPKQINELPTVISAIGDLQNLIDSIAYGRSFLRKRFLFRGLSDSRDKLVSTIGRISDINYSLEYQEFSALREICDEGGYSRYKMESFNEELFYYGIGRHLGLISRLLDWTSGIWEALSFALNNHYDQDGSLWVMMLSNDFPFENMSPFSISDDYIHILKEDYFIPDNCVSFPLAILRRSRQHGFFSVVKEALISKPLDELPKDSRVELYCFTLSKECKNSLRSHKMMIDVEQWLYIDMEADIIKRIKTINQRITNTSSYD